MNVAVGKSEDVGTDASFVDILIGDPEIADVNPLTDHALSILGKKIGTTRVSIYGENKHLIGVFDVEVSYDVSTLQAELTQHFPRAKLRVSAVNGRIMLSGYAPDAIVMDEALAIARANAARLQLDSRVRFLESNILGALAGRRDFDFVVSNPPYVGFDEADKVQRSVFQYEPKMAVFAGDNGLDVIRPLIKQAHPALKPGGYVAMEIGFSMRDPVLALFDPAVWDEPTVVPDLQGIPRVIITRRR